MSIQSVIRRQLITRFTGANEIVLRRPVSTVEQELRALDAFGLYVHVPFCRQICPYCPYNKTRFDAGLADRYVSALRREIDRYASWLGGKPVTSLYIGGGTPTTLLEHGLEAVLTGIRGAFDVQCGVHMEVHPNDVTESSLDAIESLGIAYVSMGIEALQDRHLRTLQRPYTVAQARGAVERATRRRFKCVNADLIFALPGQTRPELAEAARMLVDLGVDQVAAYPLFEFPYTTWGQLEQRDGFRRPGLLRRRSMLRTLEMVFYDSGYRRTSVWAFTRRGVEKYCSVTVPLYVGLGASGSSYLRNSFCVNTFSVPEYCRSLEEDHLPIALHLSLTERMQMAGWLYWRLYETRFPAAAFEQRFGRTIDTVYGRSLTLLSAIGFLRRRNGEIALTDPGIYWLHAVQNLFSIGSIGQLWGAATRDPWPEQVVLA